MDTLIVDFETYYSTKDSYTLKKISAAQYVRDARFKAFGLGFKNLTTGQGGWVSGETNIRAWVNSVKWADVLLVAQNTKFDGAILAWRYGAVAGRYADTLAMSRAVLGTRLRSHSLESVAKHYGFPPKGELRTDGLLVLSPEQEKELADYCLHDVELCAEIYQRFLKEGFPQGQMAAMDWTIRAFVEPALKLDEEKLAQTAEAERKRRETIFADIGIPKSEFSSNIKFPALLTKEGYEVPMKLSPKQLNPDGTKKAIPALALGDSEFLEMLESDDERLVELCEARVAAKSTLLETRSEKLLAVAKTGLFPFDVGFSGAQQTHRYSGASGAGGNPQNLNKCQDPEEHKTGHQCKAQMRGSVTVPDGFTLIVADFSAVELRIQAWLAKEARLTALLSTSDGDPYSDFATRLYGRPIVKGRDKKERDFGKEVVLGCGYGMGAAKFAQRVKIKLKKDITEDEAKNTIGLYRGYYAGIPRLWDELGNYITLLSRKAVGRFRFAPFLGLKDGCIILPSGLRLQYPELAYNGKDWTYKVFRQKRAEPESAKLYGGKLLENLCQALAGEFCKIAIERATRAGLKCAGQVHDEILVVSKNENVQRDTDVLNRAMSTPPSWWPEIRLMAEVGSGPNWQDAKH